MQKLTTRWGKNLDKNNILTEYPRPHLVRDSYFSLNGEWEYAISKQPQVQQYDGTILVPFSPEAPLSGVEKPVLPDDYLHYRKVFGLPKGFCREKVILHFGAVDQECTVYFNGAKLGSHKGGYMPFHFVISAGAFAETNELVLRVTDKTEHSPHARGKQKLVKKGKYGSLFYTPNSGIWKPVWLESVHEQHVSDVRLTPYFDEAAVGVCVLAGTAGTASVRILDGNTTVASAQVQTNEEMVVPLGAFKPWAPETPHLYDVVVEYGEDRVASYFGMRKYSVGQDANGALRFYLNNKPFFFNGLLDQGYWPESLMTPPSDEALVHDITTLKNMGYNTMRKHVKVEVERFYYHCDKLGMVVWQDLPNGGGEYNMLFVTYLPNAFNWFARGVKDSRYKPLKRTDEEGRKQYYRDLEDMVYSLYNHPCIAVWVPFNEGWGQFDATKATAQIRRMDKTRLVNEACGWFDQGGGDMYSIHNYIRKLRVKPQNRVVALTEFGGYSYPVKGHMARQKEFGYKHCASSEELTAQYKKLIEEQIYPNLTKGLSSAIYTQISDIEEEVNGLMTYDREVEKMDIGVVKALNEKLYALFGEATGQNR